MVNGGGQDDLQLAGDSLLCIRAVPVVASVRAAPSDSSKAAKEAARKQRISATATKRSNPVRSASPSGNPASSSPGRVRSISEVLTPRSSGPAVLRAPVGASKDESHLPGSSSPRDRDRVALPRSTQCSAFATPPRQRPQSSPLSPRVTAAGIIKGNPVTAVASGSLSAGVAARSPNHGLKPRASMGGFAQGSGEGAAKGVGGGGSNRRSEDKGVVAVDPEAEKRKAHQRLEQYRKAQEAAKDQAAQQEEQKRREEREQFTRAQQLKDRQREEIYSLNTLMRRTEEHRLQCYMQRKEAERVAGAGKVPGANDSLASPGQILADDTDDGGMSDGDDDDVSSPSFSSLADKRRGKGGAPAASRLGQGASTATSTGHVLRETSYLAV